MGYITKVKKTGQRCGTHAGWNKHVDKYNKRVANKYIRRKLRKEECQDR